MSSRRLPVRLLLVGTAATLVAAYGIAMATAPVPEYSPAPPPSYSSFEAYFAAMQQRSAAEGLRPGNGERWYRNDTNQDLALLYIHGFGASPVEGAYVVERLAEHFAANAYLMRLPGHGTNIDSMATKDALDYVQAAEEALQMLSKLGERRILVATSMGAAIATYLAATYPEAVSGLILFSPFYDFVGIANLLELPGGMVLAEWLSGKVRQARQPQDTQTHHPDYKKYAYMRQYTASLYQLVQIKRLIARDEVFAKVQAPVLMFYYPKDGSAAVSAMQAAYATFKPHPQSRLVPVAQGHHVLASEFVRSDKDLILREATLFLTTLASTPH